MAEDIFHPSYTDKGWLSVRSIPIVRSVACGALGIFTPVSQNDKLLACSLPRSAESAT